MNDTIDNVPRAAIERAILELERGKGPGPKNRAEELRALLSDKSPASDAEDYIPEGIVQGMMASDEVDAVSLAVKSLKASDVDELEVVGTVTAMGAGGNWITVDSTACDKLKVGDPVTALLPVKAIIVELRGQIAKLKARLECCPSEDADTIPVDRKMLQEILRDLPSTNLIAGYFRKLIAASRPKA